MVLFSIHYMGKCVCNLKTSCNFEDVVSIFLLYFGQIHYLVKTPRKVWTVCSVNVAPSCCCKPANAVTKKSRIISHMSGDWTYWGNIDSVWCTLPCNNEIRIHDSFRQDKDMKNYIISIFISVFYLNMLMNDWYICGTFASVLRSNLI